MSKLQNIIKWLYINGKDWQCPQEFREKFIEMLESELEETSPIHKSVEEFVKEVSETKTKSITKLLEKGVKLPACDGKLYISNAKKTFKSWIDEDFNNWELDKAILKTKETLLEVREILEDGTFKNLFGSLSEDLDKLVMTQSQIIRFCEKHPTLLRQDGYGTFFLIKENNEFFVVGVRVNADGLDACVSRLEHGLVWDGEYRHRLVVPQLVA